MTRSASAIHSGTLATSSAASPDGRVCSAYDTPPLPKASSIVPTTAIPPHCASRDEAVDPTGAVRRAAACRRRLPSHATG